MIYGNKRERAAQLKNKSRPTAKTEGIETEFFSEIVKMIFGISLEIFAGKRLGSRE